MDLLVLKLLQAQQCNPSLYDDCTDRLWRVLVIVLANNSSGYYKCRTEHTFYSEISTNIGGNIGPKITASSTIQLLTMMIVQID